MKIEINISKKTAEHIRSPHKFYDCCGEAEEVLEKVQKQVNRKLFKIKKHKGGIKNGTKKKMWSTKTDNPL